MNIRPMSDADGEAVMQIYQQGCDTGHATFAEHAGEWTTWDSDHLPECRLVAEINGAMLCCWSGAVTRQGKHKKTSQSLIAHRPCAGRLGGAADRFRLGRLLFADIGGQRRRE